MSLLDLGVAALADAVRRGDVRAEEAVQEALDRITAQEPDLQAYLTVAGDKALERARRVDRADPAVRAQWALAGVPLAVKDNIMTRDFPTTAASRILEGYRPPYDATVVERLYAAGAVIVGKTNLDEFAMGSSTEHSAFKRTRNPWDLERVPGGSSGGSAATVAAGAVAGALGSDTGGSIRQPASYCGVVGLKPTYGRVSRYGLIAFASSLDQIGPITRSVADALALFRVIAGHDRRDSTSLDEPVPEWPGVLTAGVEGLSLGLPREYVGPGIQPGVRARMEEAVRRLEAAGARVREVSLPHTEYAIATYYLIAPAEASSNLARFDGVRYGLRREADDLVSTYAETRAAGFGPEVQRRIMLGTHVLSAGYYDAYYLKAQKVRTLIRQDFEAAFREVDALITPTAPEVAFPHGARTADPLAMYLSDVFTVTANLAGLPALSVPVGRDGGLPVGLQVLAPPLREDTVFRVGAWIEAAFKAETGRPPRFA
ncbi:glutamyl-tRNA(Gln) amidotransferase (subunit A) [Candidatus Hydrogenisulfobacillus filiaventi]|uniref:Glutamyl-tRNA(Gln) amidotransferase subunit A n=1 Tax=Candidatus Hydrogenisulfobacillus filiaventi TaxID=2707344 RepID=A0A6F8ZGX9_9FIRM|nr:Asp-tRNA(Asn)/Glu-tRNA(Gln) amidotransferase subunit GatA [Bacillota bacterium]CAB1129245.1 glutamyl-tRNA(Gln) amidotransferase (subunit A) [Candidatus Hydrogenisulfobacillus filiaventi]